MTQEEYNLLENHNYSTYTGWMGKVFSDWYDKKIDGTKAVQMLEQWYNKGLKEIENEKHFDIQKKELERCFDALDSYIRKNELIEEPSENYENNFFMILLKNTAQTAYKRLKKALVIKLVVYENGYFNFKCAKGCVGLFFSEAGFTDYKRIEQHILINGEKPKRITLVNSKKNPPPKEWDIIEKQLLP